MIGILAALAISQASASLIGEPEAKQLALTVARARLARGAKANRSDAAVDQTGRSKTSLYYTASATNPCLPGQAVCSSLLGHFRVERTTGQVFDEDIEPERPVSD